MDILDKLNNYAAGYRDHDSQETLFAEAASAVIEELRAIRGLLEGPADKRANAAHAVDTRRRSQEASSGATEGGDRDSRRVGTG